MQTQTTTLERTTGDAPDQISDARFTALVRLIGAVRNNKVVAPLPDNQMAQVVEDWHEILIEVPTDELKALRLRGIALGLERAADFLTHYRKTEETRLENEERMARKREDAQWRQQQEERAKNPEAQKLSVSARAFQLQAGRHRRGLLGIACDCKNESGLSEIATLNDDARFWKCAGDRCQFHLPVEKTDTHNAGKVGPLGGGAVAWNRPVARPDKNAASKEQSQTEKDARACGLDLELISPPDFANFRLFIGWLRARYEGPLSPEIARSQWDIWARERANKRGGRN